MDGAVAVLKRESSFYSVFPDGRAPVFPLGPQQVKLQGMGEVPAYVLDVNRVPAEQVDQLARFLAERFQSPVDDVREFLLKERRLPIRASEVERTENMGVELRMVV